MFLRKIKYEHATFYTECVQTWSLVQSNRVDYISSGIFLERSKPLTAV